MVNMSITHVGGIETISKVYPQVTRDSPRDIFEMRETDIEPIKRDHGPAYQTFSLPYDRDTAIMQFEERYGYEPEEAFENLGNLYIGPVEAEHE